MPLYVVIKYLPTKYSEKNSLQWIGNKLLNANSYDTEFKIYPSLKEAQQAINKALPVMQPVLGLAEIEMDKEKLEAMRTKKEKADEQVIADSIKAIHIRGVRFPAEQIDLAKHEENHIKKLQYDPNNVEALQLSTPPLLYLSQLDPRLYFLLFMDHKLFDYLLEIWREYHDREPGCVSDLFQAVTNVVCEYLTSTSIKKPLVQMQDITRLHDVLSQSVFKHHKDKKSGVFREGYNCFPLAPDTVSKKGIKRLLLRIKKDNKENGFVLGEMSEINIVSRFCMEMSTSLPYNMGPFNASYPDKFVNTVALAIENTCKKIQQEYKDIKRSDIEKIITEFIKDYKPMEQVEPHSQMFWSNLRNFFSDMSKKTRFQSTKAEYQFKVKYARDHAVGHSHYFKEKDIDSLADDIFNKITKEGKTFYIFPPEAKLAQKYAQDAIAEYNNAIVKAKTVDECIHLIDDLAHELEILHLFHDVNCRTCYVTKNMLLLAVGLGWDMEYNPNRMDCLDSDEQHEQTKIGICRTAYIMTHQQELLERLALLEKKYAMRTDLLDEYKEIARPLIEKLISYQQSFNKQLTELVKEYEILALDSQKIFANSDKKIPYSLMHKALIQLQTSKNILHFIQSISMLDKHHIPKKMNKDIECVLQLAGYNKYWALMPINPKADFHF